MENTLVLGIDTSCKIGSVSLSEGQRPLGEISLEISARSSEKVMPAVDFLLKQTNRDRRDIGLVALSIGPGSYTGLRVGLSTAKAICYANNIQMVTVNTLHALAERLPLAFFAVAPLIDARASLVYSALYKWGEEKIPTKARKLDDFIDMLPDDMVIFTGLDLNKFGDKIKEKLGEKAVLAHNWVRFPSALVVSHIGFPKFLDGDTADIDGITPEYLRDFMPKK
ncbi:MAG: tRNA (adenosine(37)-N6)-threonylcarbamoyltransferase complex dimerization subunit type 1 TsaB [Candidatus Zixiibacteriota bacterium]